MENVFANFKIAILKAFEFFGVIVNHFTNFINRFLSQSSLTTIIQGFALALITILIPLAIAVLSDIYRKREDTEYAKLDLHVILDSVFKIKTIIFSILAIFIPILFWNVFSTIFGAFAFIVIMYGLLRLIKIVVNNYKWVKGNVFDFRFYYLRRLKDYDDLEIVWKSIWKVKKINIQNEKKFCLIFFSKIDHLIGLPQNNLIITSKLLNDFYSFINERSIYLLLEPSIAFNRILEWHFKTWQNKYMYIKNYLKNKTKSKSSFNYSEILRVLDSILNHIEEHSFKEMEAFSFFSHFKKHAEKYKDEIVGNGNKHFYISYLFDLFYKVLFKNIEKIDFSVKLVIWDQCFPKEWKISKTNLTDKRNKLFSNLSLRRFINWALHRISQAQEEKDFLLGEVLSNLFPEVEPNLWAKILIFAFSSSKDRVKLAIEKPWDFGPISRAKLYSIEEGEEINKKMSEDIEKEKLKTYELAHHIFKEFSKENIGRYIKEIETLKYPIKSPEENSRLELLNIFKEMLDYMSKIKKC